MFLNSLSIAMLPHIITLSSDGFKSLPVSFKNRFVLSQSVILPKYLLGSCSGREEPQLLSQFLTTAHLLKLHQWYVFQIQVHHNDKFEKVSLHQTSRSFGITYDACKGRNASPSREKKSLFL